MVEQGLLAQANERAQRRFRAMLAAYDRTGTWETPETALYTHAERLVDALLGVARWEASKGELDALIAADIEHDEDVRAMYDDRTEDYWAAYETEAELRAAWGDR